MLPRAATLERPLRLELPRNIGRVEGRSPVDHRLRRRRKQRPRAAGEDVEQVVEVVGHADGQAGDQRRLAHLPGRHHHPFELLQRHRQQGWQQAAHGPHPAVEAQLAEQRGALQRSGVELSSGSGDGGDDSQVKDAGVNSSKRLAGRCKSYAPAWEDRSADRSRSPQKVTAMPHFFDDFLCPYCRRLTSFDLEGTLPIEAVRETVGTTTYGGMRYDAARYACQNPRCGRPILVLLRGSEPMKLLHPPTPGARTLDPNAPVNIGEAYAEASQCQVIGAMRAAGAMYRMALELICDEKGIPRNGNNAAGKTYSRLVNRVGDLESKGLPHDLTTDLHEVRLVGNDSVHEGIGFSVDELDDIAGMIEEAVEVLWVQPAQRAAMKAARDARRNGAAPASNTPAAPTPPATQSTTVV